MKLPFGLYRNSQGFPGAFWVRAGVLLVFLSGFFAGVAPAADMRDIVRKAQQEVSRAQKEAHASRTRISGDRARLEARVAELEGRVNGLKAAVTAADTEYLALREARDGASVQGSNATLDLREQGAAVRMAAKDLLGFLKQYPPSANTQKYQQELKPLLNTDRAPKLADAQLLVNIAMEEMQRLGEVRVQKTQIVGRSGREQQAAVLSVGPFSSMYRDGRETGFLRYSEDTGQLFALPALPDWFTRRQLDRYLDGQSDTVPIDIARGAALQQLVHTNTLVDQIRKGGPLVWPILAIALLGAIMALERVVFLQRVHDNADRVMTRVNNLAREGRWEECESAVFGKKNMPVYNVLKAGLKARGESRETLESILQEAILHELPRLERSLPMLNMLGAVAPLLGLLGTVTGMIGTFHVITLYGTGDPRMMSGGISEALVTTMLGLAVAIPLMLVHTFLNRRVEHIVGDMEEKAVALTNVVYREQRSFV